MFTTVSQEIWPNWRVDIDEDGIVRLGPGAFLEPGYWERFFDDDEDAIRTFEEEFLRYRHGIEDL